MEDIMHVKTLKYYHYRGSSASIETRLRAGGLGSLSGTGNDRILSHHHDRIVSGALTASYPLGTVEPIPGVICPDMKLTTHIHKVPKLRMCGAMTPLPQYGVRVRLHDLLRS
jgi:hypothetical protein